MMKLFETPDPTLPLEEQVAEARRQCAENKMLAVSPEAIQWIRDMTAKHGRVFLDALRTPPR